MRRFAVLLLAGAPALVHAQGFAVNEHNTCTMGRAGAVVASPCADGSALFHNPAGLSAVAVAPGVTFGQLGIPAYTDFVDAVLKASGNGVGFHFGVQWRATDRLSFGGRWLTRRTIKYDGTANFTQIATGLILPPGNP